MAAPLRIVKNILQPKYIRNVRVFRNFSSEKSVVPSSKETKIVEKETHTGQQWDEDDYRLVRFTETPKLVNEQFAIDLIDETPPIAVKGRVTYCDGGGDLGHPKVYINVDQPGNHICGYCGLRFYQDTSHGH